MKSITADKLRLDHEPVAIFRSNTMVEEATDGVSGGPIWKGLVAEA
ncbi:MAG: hypothetical protein WC295_00145 [Methanoregula sp.]|jgi:hypothetical protein